MTIISLGSALGTIDLPADSSVIELDGGLPLASTTYYESQTLVNESLSRLANENGYILVALVSHESALVPVIDLGV